MAGYGLTLRFEVTIDHKVELGNWTKCEGLTVEWELQEYREGGLNDYVHRLPGRRKFQNIKLTRPIDADSARSPNGSPRSRGPRPVTPPRSRSWTPRARRSWSGTSSTCGRPAGPGPNMDVNGKDIAFETLELAHNGFSVA